MLLETSPEQGLTSRDFHPRSDCINPRDVFPSRTRPSSRFRSPPLRYQPLPVLAESHYGCCLPEEPIKAGCVNINDAEGDVCCGSGPASPKSCQGDCDQCEDCIEDHQLCADQDDCVKDCDDCLDEHDQACGQHGQVCIETCDDCDFSCFDCVDWNEFEKDRSLGLSFSVPLLGQENQFDLHLNDLDIANDFKPLNNHLSPQDSNGSWGDTPVAPVNLSVHHQCQESYWQSMMQPQLCPPANAMDFTSPMSGWAASAPQFGCHPAAIHAQHQYSMPSMQSQPLPSIAPIQSQIPTAASDTPITDPNALSCQWLMPCGTTCSASFANVADLKKHLKAVHCPKGTTTCAWGDCTANFGSEAALTGHISKKHLSAATANDDSGPFKCTFPGCTKSFMYKQVLMSHLASHSGENKAYCHICDQFLNAEGSNFRRHMQSHRPKHEHLICKWHHLGCKRRFPRLDNLRRHEGCCKYGKKAAIHHHHYHLHNKDGLAH